MCTEFCNTTVSMRMTIDVRHRQRAARSVSRTQTAEDHSNSSSSSGTFIDPLENDTPSSSCEVCDSKQALKRCTRCRHVHYCSTKHQKQDWKRHEPSCFKAIKMGLLSIGCVDRRLIPVQVPNTCEWLATKLSPDSFAPLLGCSPGQVTLSMFPSMIHLQPDVVMFSAMKISGCPNEHGSILFFVNLDDDLGIPHYNATEHVRVALDKYKSIPEQHPRMAKEVYHSYMDDYRRTRRLMLSTRTINAIFIPMLDPHKPRIVKVNSWKLEDQSLYLEPWLGSSQSSLNFGSLKLDGTSDLKKSRFNYEIQYFMSSDGRSHLTAFDTKIGDGGNLLVFRTLPAASDRPVQYINARMKDIKLITEWFTENSSADKLKELGLTS